MTERHAEDIFSVTKKALLAHGAGAWQADEVAKATTHSEQHGNVICGLQYVESYCTQLASGRVDGQVQPVITQPRPAAVLADAKCGFAQPAFAAGRDLAIETARKNGVAMFAVAQSHTY